MTDADFVAEQFIRWRANPTAFVEEFGRCRSLWSKQREVLRAVRDHRRVAVASAHGVGKSFIASWLAWWWILCHRDGSAKVVITAPSRSSAQEVLAAAITARWDEFALIYTEEERELLGLGDRPSQRGWRAPWNAESGIEWFATREDDGRETGHASRAAGRHADHLLFIFEEFSGIAKAIYDSIQGSMFGQHRHFLGIGNPVDSSSVFARCYRSPDFHPIRVSALDFPNVRERRMVLPYGPTFESIEEAKREYGEGSGFYEWKVEGRFPTHDTESLISHAMLEAAFKRRSPLTDCEHPVAHVVVGVDVARSTASSADWTVTYSLCGRCDRIIETDRHHGESTVTTAGRTLHVARAFGLSSREARQIGVDDGGVGGGVTDRMNEEGFAVRRENFAAKPVSERNAEKFRNRRMELWWLMKEWIEKRACLASLDESARDKLREDLTAPKFWPLGDGRVLQLESKDDVRARLGRSPDDGDALALAVAGLRPRSVTAQRREEPAVETEYDERDRYDAALAKGERWALNRHAMDAYSLGDDGNADHRRRLFRNHW